MPTWDDNELSPDEIERRIAKNLPGKLSKENVPSELHHLIPLAEQWGNR